MLAVERSVSFSIIENNLCRSIFISRGLPSPFSPSGDSRFRTETITQLNHIKKRGNLSSSLIPRTRLWYCPSSEDKQCRSPRCMHIREYTQPWTLAIALPCGRYRMYQILYAADKTLTQRLLCLSPARKPVNGPRTIDDAKVQKLHYDKHIHFIQ